MWWGRNWGGPNEFPGNASEQQQQQQQQRQQQQRQQQQQQQQHHGTKESATTTPPGQRQPTPPTARQEWWYLAVLQIFVQPWHVIVPMFTKPQGRTIVRFGGQSFSALGTKQRRGARFRRRVVSGNRAVRRGRGSARRGRRGGGRRRGSRRGGRGGRRRGGTAVVNLDVGDKRSVLAFGGGLFRTLGTFGGRSVGAKEREEK